jgi:hypothetical protein
MSPSAIRLTPHGVSDSCTEAMMMKMRTIEFTAALGYNFYVALTDIT